MNKKKDIEISDLNRSNNRLRQERIQHNWRQQDLADHLGTTVVTINRWERGIQQPSAYFRLKLCALFGKNAQELGLIAENTQPQQNIEIEIVTSTENLATSLSSDSEIWGLPYPRNPFFTGREEILLHLHNTLRQEKTLVISQSYALSGLGGIGKTQTVIEYAHRYANDYSAVLWISAETYETIVSSLITIANILNLPEKQEQNQEKITVAVTRWLINHHDWLLIFDNVEDIKLAKDILPPARYGSLLFTSRRQALGLTTLTLDLEPMTSEEGMRFLLQRARLINPTVPLDSLALTDLALAKEIVAAMDGLPLAIDQAGAYIETTKCSLSSYLQLFQSSQLHLLDERETHADHPLSVAKTFSLVFDQLEQNNAVAAEMLTVCAFMAPDAIPEMLFVQGAVHLGSLFETLTTDPFQFHTTIKALLTHSLIQRDATAQTVTIHRLVQVVLQERLSETNKRAWITRIIHTMVQLFPIEMTQTNYWQTCEQLLPHALACITLSDLWSEEKHKQVILMSYVATYLANRARFGEAEPLFLRALSIEEQVLGSKHSTMTFLLNGLASLYRDQGKYDKAEPLYQQTLRIWEQQGEPDHPEVATLLNGLAFVYLRQGKYEEAESFYQRALLIREQTLGSEHSEVAHTLSSLATLYFERGKYDKAEPLFLQAILIWKRQIGSEHSKIAASLNNLANLYAVQGKYDKAEPLFQEALRILEQLLGPQHPNVARSLTNLATLYFVEDKYTEAEPLFQRVLHIWEQQLGDQHPDAAYSLNNLAELYVKQKKYAEAEPLFLRALVSWEQLLGPQHLETARSLNGLGNFYSAQNRYEEAEPLFQRALLIRKQVVGTQHPDTAETMHNIARLRAAQGNNEEAKIGYSHTLTIREQALGIHHPKTTETRICFIALLHTMGLQEEAVQLESSLVSDETR